MITEAAASGTPVIASRIEGNAGLLSRPREAICDRAPLFEPARERRELLALVRGLESCAEARPRARGERRRE